MTVRLVALLISATSVVTWIVWRQIRTGSRKRRSVPVPPPNPSTVVAPVPLSSNLALNPAEHVEESRLSGRADGFHNDLRISPHSPSKLECDKDSHSTGDSGLENADQPGIIPTLPPDVSNVFVEESLAEDLQSTDSDESVQTEGLDDVDSTSTYAIREESGSTLQVEDPRIADILLTEDDDDDSALLLDDAAENKESPHLPANRDAPIEDFSDISLDETPVKLRRYRPPSQKSPNTRERNTSPSEVKRRVATFRQLDIVVHIILDRHGFCAVYLLPVRTADLNETISARYPDGSLELVAQEEWYQDLPFEEIASYLRNGIELRARLDNRQPVRWTLTGRDVYVLATHPDASGYVSTNRLVLGRSHLVMCIGEQVEEVSRVLREAGCDSYTQLDQSSGVPEGWILFRGVTPTKAIILGEGADQYYALKPAPDLEIEFEGGICIRNSEWLVGYPPQIKLFGQISDAVKVFVDGVEAQRLPDGTILAATFDSLGQHTVVCEGLSHSRSYSIVDAPESWEMWPAYRFSGASICGPIIQPHADAADNKMVCVPTSNPLLIGAEPGQIFRCTVRSGGIWKGLVPFDPIWALPAHPLICRKSTARIIQLSELQPQYSANSGRAELNWSNAILDAARKGLRIETSLPDATLTWAAYRELARRIRRRAKR